MVNHRARRAPIEWGRLAAMSMLLLCAAAQADCKYKQLGIIPSEWIDQRLVISGTINDTPMKMVVDTGASRTTVSGALAQRLNLTMAHVNSVSTGFGGVSEDSLARLDELSLGRFQWHNAKVQVAWSGQGLPDVLAGVDLMLQHDVEMNGKQIVFFAPSGCDDTSLAYWAADVPWVATERPTPDEPRLIVTVQVNGQPIRALVDTGAPTTLLDSAAARRLGFDPDDVRTQVGRGSGIGAHTQAESTATFDTIAVGDEIIKHPRVLVANLWQNVRDDLPSVKTVRYVESQPEMILGADFLSSHRVLFANSQRRMYFSYLGGEAFRAPRPKAAAAPAAASGTPASAQKAAAGG